MTFASWLRGLTHGSVPTLKKSHPSAAHAPRTRYRPSLERLEDRDLLAAYDLGFGFGLGSTGSENSLGVATDAAGDVVVAASFGSASIDLDPSSGTYLLTNSGGYDGLAAKYDPAGKLLWGVHVGGTGNESVSEVEVDGAGNVLIAGSFAGTINIGAPGQQPVTLTNGGISEGFLAKLDPAGNALWARTFAGADLRLARDITTDAVGNLYATGKEGENRLFVAKYSASGAELWSRVDSGVGTAANGVLVYGERVAVDTAGNVVVVGPYGGKIDFNPDPLKTNFLTSIGLFPGGADVFVLKLNATGAYVWAGSMGGPGSDVPNGLAVDGAGNVLVSGLYGTDTKKIKNDFDPGPGTLNLSSPNGLQATFVVKLDPNRNLIWARSVAVINVRDMALDAAGNVYTTGLFSGTSDFDPGPGTFNLTAGGTDAYVSKLNSSGNFVSATDILKSAPGSTGNPFNIAVDGSGNVYTSGYFNGTVDFDPSPGTYSLTSTPDSSGNPTMDAFVSKLGPLNALQSIRGMAPSSAASDTVFASLGTTSGSGTSLNTPAASVGLSAIQASATPSRVETKPTALQPTLARTGNSASISSSAPRKTLSTVDAVFNLLGR